MLCVQGHGEIRKRNCEKSVHRACVIFLVVLVRFVVCTVVVLTDICKLLYTAVPLLHWKQHIVRSVLSLCTFIV